MGQVSLGDLIASAQQFADMEQNTFISQQEWINLVNFGLRQYWNKINQLVERYNMLETFFNTTSGVTDYPLPSEGFPLPTDQPFMSLMGLDVALLTGTVPPAPPQVWLSLMPYEFKERSQYNYPWFVSVGGMYGINYNVMSTFIRLLPAPIPSLLLRLSYIPVAPTLVNLTDNFNGYNGFAEYAAAWAAWRALKREESPTGEIGMIISEWEKTIATSAQDRNKDIGARVTDINRRDLWGFW